MAGSNNLRPPSADGAPDDDTFPEIFSELLAPEPAAPPPPPPPNGLLTSNSRGAVTTRVVLAAVLAALYLQYYFYDVMHQIYTLPHVVVNVPPQLPV